MAVKAAVKAIWAVGLLFLISASAWLAGAGNAGEQIRDEPLEVIFPVISEDSGCTILVRGTSAVLIDASSETDAPYIAALLRERGVSELSAIILTCPDDGLIGGAEAILREFPAKFAVMPDFRDDSDTLDRLSEYLTSERISVIVPKYNRKFLLNGVSVTVLPPLEGHYGTIGNYSLGVLAVYGDTKMLFAGNADKKRTYELLQYSLPKIDLYKVANLGKHNDYSAELIEKLTPKTAVIANTRADAEILESLSNVGSDVLYVQRDDLIIMLSGDKGAFDLTDIQH
jgi:beta-lactamase superfamily II metal-dependent hydrolase